MLPITTFKTLDEAINYVNDREFGLTASIHTTNTGIKIKALNKIHIIETYFNREHFEAYHGFHQGVRKSGIGGDDGDSVLMNSWKPISATLITIRSAEKYQQRGIVF